MSRLVAAVAAITPLLVLLAAPGVANAHGRFPETHGLTFHPADDSVLVAATTFGPVRSDDGGITWRWACELGLALTAFEDPPYVLMEDGSLLAATFGGLVRSESSLCNFDVPDDDLDFAVIDVVRDPDAPSVAYAVDSAGGVPNGVFRTEDNGQSWQATSEPIEPILFESLRYASGGRFYLSGIYPETPETPRTTPYLHRSVDGGATWERFDFAFEPNERTFALLTLDPSNSDVVFAVARPRTGVDQDERLLRSRDGGETWETLARHRSITGAAFLDGALFVGSGYVARPSSPNQPVAAFPHGLYRSDDGGDSFMTVREDLDVGCVAVRHLELWICADAYRDGYLLGRSLDGGTTVEPRLVLTEMAGPVDCAEGDRTPQLCRMRDADIVRDFSVGGGSPDDPRADADPPGDVPPSAGGCGCRIVAPASSGSGALTLIWVLVTLATRRRAAKKRARGVGIADLWRSGHLVETHDP